MPILKQLTVKDKQVVDKNHCYNNRTYPVWVEYKNG